MTTEIRIYVEGGGDSQHTKGALRQGFESFLKPVREIARKRKIRFQVIMCGSCQDAYLNYLSALKTHRQAVNVLLVDSEGPVAASDSPGDHLRKRDWKLPRPFDPRYHLMVQAMEALFMADADALVSYYGQNLRRSALPVHANLEEVTVNDLSNALKAATNRTASGEYKKIQHAAKLLQRLNVARVRTALSHCDRFFLYLESLL